MKRQRSQGSPVTERTGELPGSAAPVPVEPAMSAEASAYERRHRAAGWWGLLVFLALGVLLEALHAFKVAGYVGGAGQVRRWMWALAHTHGTLVALVHLAMAAELRAPGRFSTGLRSASVPLLGAGCLLPSGFFLGGAFVRGGDPGVGILLVPAGALLLVYAVLRIALARPGIATAGDEGNRGPTNGRGR